MLFLLPTKTKKRKCTKEGDEEAQPQKRLEQQTLHQLNTLPSSSLKALSMVFGKEFFNSTYHPQSLMSNSVVSEFGKDILQSVDLPFAWVMFCDL